MKCPNCGGENDSSRTKCMYCDKELPKKESTIVQNITYNVTNNNANHTNVTSFHSASQPSIILGTTESSKSKMIALILCIFFGYFGVHYFYVGKVGKGVVYVFTVGLFGIGWIVDIFRILGGSFRDKKGLPLR